jgi:hypothetical protein
MKRMAIAAILVSALIGSAVPAMADSGELEPDAPMKVEIHRDAVEMVGAELFVKGSKLEARVAGSDELIERIATLLWVAAVADTEPKGSEADFFWDVVWPAIYTWACSVGDCSDDGSYDLGSNGEVVDLTRQYINEYDDDDDGEKTQDDGLWSGDGCQWAPTCSSSGGGTGGSSGYTSLSDFLDGISSQASWNIDIDVRATFEEYVGELFVVVSPR